MKRALIRAAVAAALLAPTPALAWTHLYHAWLPDDMPLEFYVSAPADCEESVPDTYCQTATEEAWGIWMSTPCIDFEAVYAGECENIGYNVSNGMLYNTFNDPAEELEPGVIAAALTVDAGRAFVLDGSTYGHAFDSDIVYNNDVLFDTRESILAGQCNGGHDLVGIAVHEIGHTIGLGHSCEENEVCTDPNLRTATMYWSGGPCDAELAIPNEDDLEGLTALYGPYAAFVCSHEVSESLAVGVVPFELKCVITTENVAEITSASWRFGDGGTSSDIAASHTYTEPGNYTVQVTVQGQRDGCGEDGWEYNYRRVGYVRACGVPDAQFVVEHQDGLTYQMANETDVSVYGCIQDIEWQVYEGSGTNGKLVESLTAKAWEPLITFPDEGTYTVVLNVGGPAGTGGASVTFDARRMRGEGYGCQHGGSPAFGFGALFGLLLVGGRRRR